MVAQSRSLFNRNKCSACVITHVMHGQIFQNLRTFGFESGQLDRLAVQNHLGLICNLSKYTKIFEGKNCRSQKITFFSF